jgi:hypothetical protein
MVDKSQFVPGNTCAAASLKDQLGASASSGRACPRLWAFCSSFLDPRFWAFPGRFDPRSWRFVSGFFVPGPSFLTFLLPGVLVLDVAGYWESWELWEPWEP